MIGYRFTLTCRWCGELCEHVNGGQHCTFETVAIARCMGCGTEWTVNVTLSDPSQGRKKITPAKLEGLSRARAASADARRKVVA